VAGDDIEARQEVVELAIPLQLHDHVDVQGEHDPLAEGVYQLIHADVVDFDVEQLDFAVHGTSRKGHAADSCWMRPQVWAMFRRLEAPKTIDSIRGCRQMYSNASFGGNAPLAKTDIAMRRQRP